MPTGADPVEFVREVATGKQRAYNKVQVEAIGTDGSVNPVNKWIFSTYRDNRLNNNDKQRTCPPDREWHVLWIRVTFATAPAVGDRQLAIEFRDPNDNIIFDVIPALVQAAGNTYNYNFGPSMGDLDAVRDGNWISTPMPPTGLLSPGYDVRIYDNNNVSALDDIITSIHIAERPL